jgi:hypothetical protein
MAAKQGRTDAQESPMFKVKQQQIQQLSSNKLEQFLDEMEAWTFAQYGPRAAMLGNAAIRSEVVLARQLGFTLRGHAKRWLRMAVELGTPLAELPWAMKIARDETLAAAGRLHLMECETVMELLPEDEEFEDEEIFYAGQKW